MQTVFDNATHMGSAIWGRPLQSLDCCRLRNAILPIPLCAYRLQLGPEFGFREAALVVDYLCELGVSHAYCSPYLQASPGSTRCYDVVDYHRVSDDLGGDTLENGEASRYATSRAALMRVYP
jgi:hypothetical protein